MPGGLWGGGRVKSYMLTRFVVGSGRWWEAAFGDKVVDPVCFIGEEVCPVDVG